MNSNRIEALERLAALHQSGSLSDAEFESEKVRLLSSEENSDTTPVYVRYWWIGAVAVLSLALIAAFVIDWKPSISPATKAPATSSAPEESEKAAKSTIEAMPSDVQLQKAFEAAFGKSGQAVVNVESGSDYGTDSFPEKVKFTPGKLLWTSFGPVLLSKGEVVDASHVQAGKIGAHYLAVDNDGFRLEKAYPKAVVTGSFGHIGEWSVSKNFLSSDVIFVEGGGMWQGYACSWATLTAVYSSGPKELVTFPVSYSNSGAVGDGPDAVDIGGKVQNIVKGKSFEVVYGGSRSFKDRYVFKNGGYVVEGGQSQMETC